MQILNAIYVIAYRKKMKKTKKEGVSKLIF